MEDRNIELMKRALHEAALSKYGKPSDPLVGAVLYLNNIGTPAHRGQFAPGDHAEFTLLQKILKSTDLIKGGTLYTTLEPCTTRSHDKRPCADWIIQKGVKRVLIGMLDPNPAICGRGYWKLVDAGIEVELFRPDLASEIRKLNVEFIRNNRGGIEVSSEVAWWLGQNKSRAISPYTGVGWSDALSIQDHPDLRQGWPASAVAIRSDLSARFELPERFQEAYQQYRVKHHDDRRFMDDKDKLMLAKNPTAFSDSPSLVLQTKVTRWSEIQFYREHVATVAAEKGPLIERLIRESLEVQFPNALCMHLLIVTSDNNILLTKRSPKVAYHPNTWSASVEEQLDIRDLSSGNESDAQAWTRRFVREELGYELASSELGNLRVLSVFLESDTLNISLAACVQLSLTSEQLESQLRHLPRTDYEFTEWAFLELQKRALLRELLQPSRAYHPTTGYRLLLALFRFFGAPSDEDLTLGR